MTMFPDLAKDRGVFYTPDRVASEVLRQVLPTRADEIADAAFCDPACGDGAFLVPAADYLMSWLAKPIALEACARLTGFDIDEDALRACRANLDRLLWQHYPGASVDWRLERRDGTDRLAFAADRGAFTHVFGNPPYVRVQRLSPEDRLRLAEQWSVTGGNNDLYVVFFQLGLDLLRKGGMLAYVAPSAWMRMGYGRALRRTLVTEHRVRKLIDYGERQLFQGATTYCAVPVIEKYGTSQDIRAAWPSGDGWESGTIRVDQTSPESPWTAMTEHDWSRMDALLSRGPRLAEVADIRVGIQTHADDTFIMALVERGSDLVEVETGDGTIELEAQSCRPVVKASALSGGCDPVERVVVYPYDHQGRLLPEPEIADRWPKTYRWLCGHKDALLARDRGRFDADQWYAFGRTTSLIDGFDPRIVTPMMSDRPNFQRVDDTNTTFYGGYCVKPKVDLDMDQLLEALNSDDMAFYISRVSQPYRGGYFSYAKSFIKNFALPELFSAQVEQSSAAQLALL